MSGPLTGLRVLITRPEPQGQRLAQCLTAAGADTWQVPLLEIEPLAETADARRPLLDLDLFEHVIVTSVPAAEQGLAWIENCWPQLPLGPKWWAIGAATAQALAQFAIKADYSKEASDSEALLAEPLLQQVSGQRVLLLTGEGGRGLIAQVLRERGAELVELPLYRRRCPVYPEGWLAAQLQKRRCHWIVVTSGQLLDNLLKYLSVDSCPAALLVPSERIRQQALAAGFRAVHISHGAGDQAVLDALISARQ